MRASDDGKDNQNTQGRARGDRLHFRGMPADDATTLSDVCIGSVLVEDLAGHAKPDMFMQRVQRIVEPLQPLYVVHNGEREALAITATVD